MTRADDAGGSAAITTLERRLRSADAWRYRLDTLLVALGQRRNRWLFELPYLARNVISDVLESLRSGNGVTNLGHAYITALDGPSRLPQPAKYRSYWYDAGTHSLVGMHLGLDLIHSGGKYYFIEGNLDAGLNPARRKLYESGLDPIILESVAVAKAHGFDRLVLVRHYWTRSQVDEFARATRETGVEVLGANLMAVDTRGHKSVNPMLAMPDPLEPRTMYIVYTIANATPLLHFMHNKVFASRWLEEAMAEAGDAVSGLACVPTALRLELPSDSPGDAWPNLVVKLGNADKGRAVAMGRFTTEEEARRGLRLEGGPHAIPGIFRTALSRQIIDTFFRNRTRVLYQPFIAPEVVDGRAQKVRLHLLVSPMANAFLSAHGVLAAEALPEHLPVGLVENVRPYMVNISGGGEFRRLEAEREAELKEVALEFGRLAKLAIGKRFDAGDSSAPTRPEQSS